MCRRSGTDLSSLLCVLSPPESGVPSEGGVTHIHTLTGHEEDTSIIYLGPEYTPVLFLDSHPFAFQEHLGEMAATVFAQLLVIFLDSEFRAITWPVRPGKPLAAHYHLILL